MPASSRALTERHPAFARILPFALLIAGIAADSLLAGHPAALPWDLRWNYALRSLAALLAMLALREVVAADLFGRPAGTASLFMRPAGSGSSDRGRESALALGVGIAVFALWIAPPLRAFSLAAGGFDSAALWGALPASAGTGFQPLDGQGRLDWGLAATRLAGSALVVPFAEELFWRSFAMRWFDGDHFELRDPRTVSQRAWWLQALAFGAEHELWLAGVLAGLAYGWLYRRTGRLWPAVLAHGLTNALLGIWVLAGSRWSYW